MIHTLQKFFHTVLPWKVVTGIPEDTCGLPTSSIYICSSISSESELIKHIEQMKISFHDYKERDELDGISWIEDNDDFHDRCPYGRALSLALAKLIGKFNVLTEGLDYMKQKELIERLVVPCPYCMCGCPLCSQSSSSQCSISTTISTRYKAVNLSNSSSASCSFFSFASQSSSSVPSLLPLHP
ncbi:hypothetical protein ADUPG1_011850, partial [Aduncisulcus paluster]